MVPKIMGCIDEKYKAIILDAVEKTCASKPIHALCDAQFNQEIRQLPRCDTYRPPKTVRKLSEYQKHLSVCMAEQPFLKCAELWKPVDENGNHINSMADRYAGSGYTGKESGHPVKE